VAEAALHQFQGQSPVGGDRTVAERTERRRSSPSSGSTSSGAITGEAARMEDLEAVKRVLPETPVLANTGVKHTTVAEVLRVADGCVVGTHFKVDGVTWNPVDPQRVARFMDRMSTLR
jgi:predicted TIM-barrel enzyme